MQSYYEKSGVSVRADDPVTGIAKMVRKLAPQGVSRFTMESENGSNSWVVRYKGDGRWGYKHCRGSSERYIDGLGAPEGMSYKATTPKKKKPGPRKPNNGGGRQVRPARMRSTTQAAQRERVTRQVPVQLREFPEDPDRMPNIAGMPYNQAVSTLRMFGYDYIYSDDTRDVPFYRGRDGQNHAEHVDVYRRADGVCIAVRILSTQRWVGQDLEMVPDRIVETYTFYGGQGSLSLGNQLERFTPKGHPVSANRRAGRR